MYKKGEGLGPKMYHFFNFWDAKTKSDQDTMKHKINTIFFSTYGEGVWLVWDLKNF